MFDKTENVTESTEKTFNNLRLMNIKRAPIEALQRIAFANAKAKGWHETKRELPELIALMHSELSEALESYRKDEPLYWEGEGGKPEGVASEFADVLIRIFDACGALGIDLQSALAKKMIYNAERPYRHGGKVC